MKDPMRRVLSFLLALTLAVSPLTAAADGLSEEAQEPEIIEEIEEITEPTEVPEISEELEVEEEPEEPAEDETAEIEETEETEEEAEDAEASADAADAEVMASTVIDSGYCGSSVVYVLDSDGVLTISGTGEMDFWWYYDEPAPWHSWKSSIKSIVIENGVTSIADFAFYYCNGLTSVTIPNSVTSIGESAFSDCTSLREVYFKGKAPHFCRDRDGNPAIGFYETGGAYSEFKNVSAKVYYPKNDKSWTEYVRHNYGGDLVWYPYDYSSGVAGKADPQIIGAGIEHDNLTWKLTPDGKLTISGNGAMISFGVTTDWDYHGDFAGFSGIHPYWGYAKEYITEVDIQSGITSIGAEAFDFCINLKKVNIAATVQTVEHNAFANCTNLKEIFFRGDAPAFPAWCSDRWYHFKYTPSNAFAGVTANVYYPKVNQTWNNYTRLSCGGDITWYPYNYTTGQAGKADEPTLRAGTCGENLKWFLSTDGVLNIDGTGKMFQRYISYYDGDASTDYSALFWPKEDVKKVEIGADVESISYDAFQNCSALKEIKFKGNVPVFDIDEGSRYPKVPSPCFSGVTAIAYYPKNNATWTFDKLLNYGGNITWKTYDPVTGKIEDPADATGKCGTNLQWTLSGAGKLTITGSGAMENYTTQSAPWYVVRERIKSVEVSASQTTVGNCAFEDCVNLESVVLPKNCGIGDSAFYNCQKLKTVTFTESKLPNSSVMIGTKAFSYCTGLTSIEIPSCITIIGETAFEQCTALETVTLNEGLKRINRYAFSGCSALTQITIPGTVTNVETYAFGYCSKLAKITFQGDAPAIDAFAFADVKATAYYPAGNTSWVRSVLGNYGGTITWEPYATGLSGTCGKSLTWELDVDGNLVISGTGAMDNFAEHGTPWEANLTKIKTVTVGSGVTYLGDRAFEGCTGLTKATLPETLTACGQYVFNGCTALTSVNVPSSLKTLGVGMFRSCSALKSITLPAGLTDVASWAFYGCTGLTTVTIPNGVTAIGKNTFQNCSNLTSVTLPTKVQSIDVYAFDGCSKLAALEIPNTVTSVGSYAFRGCAALKTVVLPDSITEMGNFVFQNCSSLASVTLSNSLRAIGINVFQNCTGLTAIDIPEKVTSIGTQAFNGCTKLKTITFHGDAPKIESGCFSTGFTANYPCSGKNWSTTVFRNTGATPSMVKYHPEKFHTDTARVEPTCTAPGSYGGIVCGSCGMKLQDATVIPALGHSYTKTVTEPTCTAKGYTTYTCERCGDSYVGDETDFAPHTFQGDWFSNADGHWHYCSVCGAQGSVEAHVPDRSAPTTTADQLCRVCGYVMQSRKSVIVIDAPNTLLIAGTTMQLSCHVVPEKEINVVWSLDAGDDAYASITQSGKVTAKMVTKQTTITAFAADVDGECLTGKLSIIICPIPSSISVREGNSVTVNVNETKTLTFTAVCAPAGCAGNVEWKTSDTAGTYGTFRDNHDNTCTITNLTMPSTKAATITLTAQVVGSNVSTTVKVKLVSAPIPGSIVVTGPDTLCGGTTANYKASVNLSVPLTDNKLVFDIRPEDRAFASITADGKLTTKAVPEAVDIVIGAANKSYPDVIGTYVVHLVPTAQQVSIQAPGIVSHDGVISKDLNKGNSIQLEASVLPIQAMQSGTWKSSSTKTATVDKNGRVTFLKAGTVTITFITNDGSKKSASVKISAGTPAVDLTISGADSLVSGGKTTLKAAFGNVPTIKKLTWSSSNPAAATVSASGAVTAKTVYTAQSVTITAKATDGSGETASHIITVLPKANVLPIWDENANVVTNQTLNLDTQTSTFILTAPEGAKWTSSAPKVVSVDNGRLTLLKAGSATITVKSSDGKQTGKVTVKVSTLVWFLRIVTDTTAPLTSGKGKLTLKTEVNADASNKAVTWSSSDPTVVSVSSSGAVTAKAGVLKDTTVVIRATAKDGSGKYAETIVTVIPAATAVHVYSKDAMTCADGMQLCAGETLNGRTIQVPVSQKIALGAKVFPNALGAHADQSVTWKSSSTKVASVSTDGVVTALKAGTVTITVKTADGKTNTVKLFFV